MTTPAVLTIHVWQTDGKWIAMADEVKDLNHAGDDAADAFNKFLELLAKVAPHLPKWEPRSGIDKVKPTGSHYRFVIPFDMALRAKRPVELGEPNH